MGAIRHLISYQCPSCNLSLFRIAESVRGDMVFCSECGAGGLHKEVIKERKPLTSGFLTRREIDDLRGQMGFGGE